MYKHFINFISKIIVFEFCFFGTTFWCCVPVDSDWQGTRTMIWVKCSIFGVKPVSKRIRGKCLLGKLKKKEKKKKKTIGVFYTHWSIIGSCWIGDRIVNLSRHDDCACCLGLVVRHGLSCLGENVFLNSFNMNIIFALFLVSVIHCNF